MMPVADLRDIPWGLWFLFFGVFLFGLVLPILVAQAIIKIAETMSSSWISRFELSKTGFFKRLVIGWVALSPLYTWGLLFFNSHVG